MKSNRETKLWLMIGITFILTIMFSGLAHADNLFYNTTGFAVDTAQNVPTSNANPGSRAVLNFTMNGTQLTGFGINLTNYSGSTANPGTALKLQVMYATQLNYSNHTTIYQTVLMPVPQLLTDNSASPAGTYIFYNISSLLWYLNNSQVYSLMIVAINSTGNLGFRQTSANRISGSDSMIAGAASTTGDIPLALYSTGSGTSGTTVSVTAKDLYDNQTLSNISVNATNFNGTSYSFSNTTGIVYVEGLLSNSTALWNITTCSNQSGGYYCRTQENYNVSSITLLESLYQSILTVEAQELITNANISGTFSTTNYTNTSGGFYIKAGTYTFTFSKSGYFSKTKSITIPALSNTTDYFVDVYNATYNVTFRDNLTNATINTVTLNTSNSTYYYNISNSTTNASILLPITYPLLYSYNASASGYFPITTGSFNVSANATNATVYLYPIGTVTIEALSAETGERILYQNTTVLIQNATTQLNFTMVNGTVNATGLSDGETYTFIFTSSGYDSTTYILTYDASLVYNALHAYLPQTTTEFEFIITSRNGQYVTDAEITVERFVNGSYVTVGSLLTNAVGSATFNVKTGLTHRINISKTGYISQSFIDTLITTPPYNIVLYQTSTFTFDSNSGGVTYSYYPTSSNLTPLAYTFGFNISTLNDITLESFSITVYDENQTILGTNTSTASTGGQLTVYKNLIPYNTSWVLADFAYTREGFATAHIVRKYYVSTTPYSGSVFEFRDYVEDNVDLQTRIWLWVLSVVATVIFMYPFIKGEGILFIGAIASLALGYLFGLNTYWLGAITAIIILYFWTA